MDVHPAIARKIEELMARAKELTLAQQQGLELLVRVLDLKDYHGIKTRAAELSEYTEKLQWISAQIDALRALPYDMAAEDMAPKRRVSTSAMPAVVLPEKKEG